MADGSVQGVTGLAGPEGSGPEANSCKTKRDGLEEGGRGSDMWHRMMLVEVERGPRLAPPYSPVPHRYFGV